MRLSDIKGERVFDVVADLMGPIASIARDKDAAELFAPKELPKDTTPWEFFLTRVERSLPPLVRRHRAEFAQIMASLKDVTPEEYIEGLTLGQFFADLTELVTDREFSAFFN